MSEQLASLHKKGGKTPVWELGSPDVSDAFTVNAGATKNVAVTQMPKFIMLYRTTSNSTADYGYIANYDVESGNCRFIGLNSGGFATGASPSSFFGNVTSSVVQVKGASSGTTVYAFAIAIWY